MAPSEARAASWLAGWLTACGCGGKRKDPTDAGVGGGVGGCEEESGRSRAPHAYLPLTTHWPLATCLLAGGAQAAGCGGRLPLV